MRVLLLLSLTTLAACSNLTGGRPGGGTGSISGKIAYPSETTPLMRICAVRAGAEAPICITSPAGQSHYRIERLPAGEYQVVASLSEGDMRVGGHVQSVQCIRAPCPEQLKSVSVVAGADLTWIDLNEFYAVREDFPPLR